MNLVFCSLHKEGPFVSESQTMSEHSSKYDDCKWEAFSPENHIRNFAQTEIINEEDLIQEQTSITKELFEFARPRISKLVVSNTDSNQVFGLIPIDTHLETFAIQSSKANMWLKCAYFEKTQKIHSDEAYRNALSLISSQAIMTDTQRETIYNRVAMVGGAVYYDLCTPAWQVAKITTKGIEIISLDENTPIFVRHQHQSAQVLPNFDKIDSLTKLVELARVPKKDELLFKVHLISMLLEKYPTPIMVVHGEHGSVKTTRTKTVKKIIDPSGANVSSIPHNKSDLSLHLYSRYLSNFDNISGFNQETSDMFARAITGEGQSKRKLFTDEDEIIWNYKRKIIVNGISPALEFPDFRDRAIFYETQRISQEERMTEEEFDSRLEYLLPFVLGEMFEILSKTLGLYDLVKEQLKHLPRMADFTIFGECISRALGNEPLAFFEQYLERIESGSLDINESYPIIDLTKKLMNDRGDNYEDTVSNYFKTVKDLANREGIDITSNHVKFPKAPNRVKPQIEILKSNFRTIGLEIDIRSYDKRDGKHPRGSHIISINKIQEQRTLPGCTESSLSPLSSPPSLDDEQITSFADRGLDLKQPLEISSLSRLQESIHENGTDRLTETTEILSRFGVSDQHEH